MAKSESKRLLTPIFRVSFPQLHEPQAFGNGDPKYSVLGIVDLEEMGEKDKALYDAMKAECMRLCLERWKKEEIQKLRKLGKFEWPFKDGLEKEDYDGYGEGKEFFRMSTKRPPAVVGRKKGKDGRFTPLEAEDVYAGCYGRARITFYTYDNESKGISIGLGNFQKVGDGDKLGGSVAAEDDFEDVTDEEFEDYADDIPGEDEDTDLEDMLS